MRTDFPSATRTEYIGGDVTPLVRATLRQLRLDFGAELFQKNDNGVIDGSAKAGDDYYDPSGHHVRYGDSCVSDVSPYCKFLLVSDCTWVTGGSSWWYARSTSGSDDWSISALSPSGSGPGTMSDYTRPGVYPGGGTPDTTEVFYVWYLDSADDLYRITLTHTISGDSWAWSGKTSGYDISVFAGAAVHPVSASEAILVAYEDPYLWTKYVTWNGSNWNDSGSDWVVFMSDELVWSDAHWSDAEPLGSDQFVCALNLNKWGSAHTVIYDKTSEVWSMPKEILPSAERWGNLRVWCSGLSTIDSKLWAVTIREPVASNDTPMARHVALCSSTDGENWSDQGFITKSELRGKLLYRDAETYCYVAGNVSVARASATNKLGYDATAMKHTVSEAHGLSVGESGPSSATQANLLAMYSADLLTSVEEADELVVELGADGQSYGTYKTMVPAVWNRISLYDRDELQIVGMGYMSKLVGDLSYKPLAAKVYDGPHSIFSNFQFANGNARLTVRQESGTWVTTRHREIGHMVLHCKRPGTSLVPRSLRSQWVTARISFQPKVSVEGIYITFWHEDEDNYWQAGVYDDSGTQKIVIDRYVDGTKTNKANSNLTAAISVGNWYSLIVDTRPGNVRAYIRRSDSYDFSATTDSTSYDVTGESSGPPESHHVGLKVEDFDGWEGALYNGTATGSGSNYLDDSGASFGSSAVGAWLRCEDQDNLVVKYTSTRLTISPGWASEPAVGAEYGVYPDKSRNGPQCYFKELFIHEGVEPWTVDDVANNIMAMCLISRSDVFTGTGVGALGSGPPSHSDTDITLTTTDASSIFYLWLSSTSASGANIYSGLEVLVEASYTTLTSVENNGASGQVDTVLAKHPNMVTIPGAATSKTLRLKATKDFIAVTCDGHFVTAFPVGERLPMGFVATSGSGVTTEFCDVLDSFIWDAGEPAASALSRLLQGRRARLIERADGSVAISRFDAELGDAGTYTTPVTEHTDGRNLGQLISLVEMVGAEERAFHLNAEAARKGLRYARADNPTLETQDAALAEAVRQSKIGWQRYRPGGVSLYIADPGLELEDRFVVSGYSGAYRVEGMEVSIRKDETGRLQAGAGILARRVPDAANTGVYDTAAYDDQVEYG